jgi:hypothetical protein
VVEYSAEFQRSLQSPGATMGQLFNSGTGRAWGADVYLRDRWRGWDGWLGCSYGVTERTIGGYNSGLTYNPPYDRRNQVVIAQGRPLGKRWRSSFTFHYGSGQPFSLPVARYSVVDITGNTYDTPLDGTAGNGRLPAYHRLDLSLSARYHVRSWTVEPELQVVNVYNHKNVYIRTYDTDKNPAVFNDITMLPLLPTVAVKVEF